MGKKISITRYLPKIIEKSLMQIGAIMLPPIIFVDHNLIMLRSELSILSSLLKPLRCVDRSMEFTTLTNNSGSLVSPSSETGNHYCTVHQLLPKYH